MTQNTITLIVLAVLVVFSLPALYRKKKNGDLTLWGKGRNILGQLPSEEAACAAVSSSARNGSQKDILQFVSSLMKLVRKNHWYIVMPGQLSDGKTKTNQYGQVLNSVTFSVPHGVAVDGYDLGGFTAKVVVVDKYLDRAADEGFLQIMLNGRYDLKLSRDDGGKNTYVTIGRDKIGEFAKSLGEKSNTEHEDNENNKKKEESLDEMMGGKNEEASLMAAGAATREATDREAASR